MGNDPVLLLDDAYVEDRWGIFRQLNIPRKHPGNPVLRPEHPWEMVLACPSVIYDEPEKIFRMWYAVWDEVAFRLQYDHKGWRPEHGYPYSICYAESPDGMHWTKPLFTDKPYKNFRKTNIVLTGVEKAQGCWVIPNPSSTGQPGKFLICYRDNLPNVHSSLCLAYSDDGVHWRPDPGNPVVVGVRDTRHNIIYDERNQRWFLYTRPMCFAGSGSIPGGPTGNFKRRAAVAIGKSPYTLGYPRCILWPDEMDAPDYDDFLVNRVGSHFLAMVTHMQAPPECRTLTHLAFSPDGLHWQRLPERTPLIGLGKDGECDAGQASSVGPLVQVGDQTFLYYYSSTLGQSANVNSYSIGLAQIQKERFVGQMGNPTGGFLLTREVWVEGNRLAVNMTKRGLSEHAFAAELVGSPREGSPQPIPGYTFAECTAGPVEATEYVLTWNGKSDLSPLRGKSIYIRFYLKNTGLYSFRFLA